MPGNQKKYNQAIAGRIVETLKQTGVQKIAYEANSISHQTYFKWLKEYPEFKARIEQAKLDFIDLCNEEYTARAKQAFEDYLFGRCVDEWRSEETIVKPNGDTEVKRAVKTVKRPTPKWVIDRILGSNVDVFDAIQVLLTAGMASSEHAKLISDSIAELKTRLRVMNGDPVDVDPIDENDDE